MLLEPLSDDGLLDEPGDEPDDRLNDPESLEPELELPESLEREPLLVDWLLDFDDSDDALLDGWLPDFDDSDDPLLLVDD